jgi:hypothetical protein
VMIEHWRQLAGRERAIISCWLTTPHKLRGAARER